MLYMLIDHMFHIAMDMCDIIISIINNILYVIIIMLYILIDHMYLVLCLKNFPNNQAWLLARAFDLDA